MEVPSQSQSQYSTQFQLSQAVVCPYSETLQNAIRVKKEVAKDRIESLVLRFLDSMADGSFPSFTRSRLLSSSKEVEKATRNPNLQTTIAFGKRSTKTFTMQVHLMSVVYQMIQTGQTSTMREMFYENLNFFENQNRLSTALNELALLLKVPREVLCVEASAKGLVAGEISFTDASGDHVSAMNSRHGMIVPNKLHELKITTRAKYVLFVEKDAIFQRLLDERIFDTLGSIIMITGKGYPDIQTRRLMSILNKFHNLKVFAFVDCDPYGIEIAAVVKWGSYRSINGHDENEDPAWQLTVPDLVWLGLLPSEVLTLSLTLDASLEFTTRDKKKVESVEKRIQYYNDNDWLHEVKVLQQTGRKTELEALFMSRGFATKLYLPSKLQSVFPERSYDQNSNVP